MTATMEKPKAAPVKPTWKMPHVEVGMIVLFYRGSKGSAPYPAVVCSVGDRTIDLLPLSATHGTYGMTGVRFEGDPDLKDIDRVNSGTWEHTAFMKAALEWMTPATHFPAAIESGETPKE